MVKPTYLPVPTLPVPQKIKVGDRVKFADGSGSLACKKDGLENIHPAMTGAVKTGLVLAVDCVLPYEEFIVPRDWKNNTVVMLDEGLVVFCLDKFLRKI